MRDPGNKVDAALAISRVSTDVYGRGSVGFVIDQQCLHLFTSSLNFSKLIRLCNHGRTGRPYKRRVWLFVRNIKKALFSYRQ